MNKKIFTIGLLTLSIMSLGSCGNGNGGGVECPTFTVTYYLNDGTDAVYQSFEVVSQTSATKPDNPTREGYIFKGWFADSECLVSYVSTTKVTADTSIYAKWIVDTSSKDETSSDVTTSDTPSTSIPNENVTTYTVTDLPDWITNDGCVIFAWVWGPNNTGEWIPTEFTSTTSLKFDVDEEITGMLLARCVPGTTTPDRAQGGDQPGEIYNQTEDIAITSGVTSYSCSSWKEYSPA